MTKDSPQTSVLRDAPKLIWAEPPDIFDGMGFWRDTSFPTGSPYILATPEALAEAPEVQALIAEVVERAVLIAAGPFPGGWSNNYDRIRAAIEPPSGGFAEQNGGNDD